MMGANIPMDTGCSFNMGKIFSQDFETIAPFFAKKYEHSIVSKSYKYAKIIIMDL